MDKQGNGRKSVRKQGKKRAKQEGGNKKRAVTSETLYGECNETMTPYGGLLALVKFVELIRLKKAFDEHYVHPQRETKLGGYRMVLGMLLLLFIGFQRLGHFEYVRADQMVCGILQVEALPVVSTFWRYLTSLSIIQSASLLRVAAALRRRVWELCEYAPRRVTVNIDTTVSTVYGKTEGSRKGHNTKHRGKKGLRPILIFLEETREFLLGMQRRGETVCGGEVARLIRQLLSHLPECVREVHVRGDGEFISWESIEACLEKGFFFTFANKRCTPPLPEDGWYRHGKYEYNECFYQPQDWPMPMRFVIMRIREDQRGDRQLKLLESENYMYRVFVTNERGRPHQVIEDYDKRADVENLIGEAQHEGLLAIPSKRFHAHHAFFQLVMLSYNLWRWMKLLAAHAQGQTPDQAKSPAQKPFVTPQNTIPIARLKTLFIPAKFVSHGNRDTVKYSAHDERAAGLIEFMRYLDRRRLEAA